MKNKLLLLSLLCVLSLSLVACKNRNFDELYQGQSGYYDNMKKQMEEANDDIEINDIDDEEKIDRDGYYRNSSFSSETHAKEYFLLKSYEFAMNNKEDYSTFETYMALVNTSIKKVDKCYQKIASYMKKHPECINVDSSLLSDELNASDLLYMLIAKLYLPVELTNCNHSNDEITMDKISSFTYDFKDNDIYPIESSGNEEIDIANRINKYIFEDLNSEIIEASKILKDAKKLFDENKYDGNVKFMN